MWLLIDSSENIKELNTGDNLTVGRSNADIVLLNDASISRNHAKIEVSLINDTEKVVIKDLGSKYGTYLLKTNDGKPFKIPDDGYEMKNNDKIRFGLRHNIFSLIFKPKIKYHVLISRVHENDKNNLQNIFDKIAGKMLNSWCDSCTHLTTTKTGITEKVACALASGIPIVNINYWNDVLKAHETKSTLPNPTKYLPPLDNAFLDDQQASLSPNLLRKKIFDGLIFYHFEKKQYDLYSTMIRLAGGRSLVHNNESLKIKECVKDNIIIVLPPDEIQTQSLAFENYQKISTELAINKLRPIPSTEIALAIYYCSTDKFCNPRFKHKKLFKSTRMSAEEARTKFPIIAEDSQGMDTSPQIIKNSRIIPESAPIDSLVNENPSDESCENILKDCVNPRKKIEESTKLSETLSRKSQNIEHISKKSDNQVNAVSGGNQTHDSNKDKSIDTKSEKINQFAQVQKSIAKDKVNDFRVQKKSNKSNDNDNLIQDFIINKDINVGDKNIEKTNESAVNLRKNFNETLVKKKRKDLVDDVAVNDDEKNNSSESKKIKLNTKNKDNNKLVWNILSSSSQDENKLRSISKKTVNENQNILNLKDNIQDNNDSVQNTVNSLLKHSGNKTIQQKETHGSWVKEQVNRRKKSNDSMKSGLEGFIFIERRVSRKRKMNCRKNQCRIPKRRLRSEEDLYEWISGK